jgi:hypothetical protein
MQLGHPVFTFFYSIHRVSQMMATHYSLHAQEATRVTVVRQVALSFVHKLQSRHCILFC